MEVERKVWGRCYWFKRFRVYVYTTGRPRVSIRRNPR